MAKKTTTTATTTTEFGFTLQIGTGDTPILIPLDMTLPPQGGTQKYEYTNPEMNWVAPVADHVPNTTGATPSPFKVDVSAFLAWVKSTLSGGDLAISDLPTELQSLEVGVDYLLLKTDSTGTTAELTVTVLNADSTGFATFTPIDGLGVTASAPHLTVTYNKPKA